MNSVDCSASAPIRSEGAFSRPPGSGQDLEGTTGDGSRSPVGRRVPSRARSVLILALTDLEAMVHSWLCRLFFLVTGLLTLLALKGMQAEQKPASQMLEAVYAMYILLWMHGIIFIAGGAFSREQDCLNDAVISRGLTRAEYLLGKLSARAVMMLLVIGSVLLPASFWAIRHDQLIRKEGGFVTSHAHNTKVEAWEPKKIFAGADSTLGEVAVELGDAVTAGDVLAQLDDRLLFDQLETERRQEENARNEVTNAYRRFEDAKRAAAQAEDALARAERALMAKDLLSKIEQSDRETELRARKRDIENMQNLVRIAQDAIAMAERGVENAQARVREARKRLGYATISTPISGYITEVQVQRSQHVGLGAHLFTVAPLDEYQVRVPIYRFDEFKRLKKGLVAVVRIDATEFSGLVDRLGATTQPDRWGRDSNYVVVRFKGNGTLGLLGLNADVRITLPKPEERASRAAALLKALTGTGTDDIESQKRSVTTGWMLIGFGKVIGCAGMLVSLTLLALALFRSTLISVLAVIGFWHLSNLLFDFVGLPDVSYLEIVRTFDKVFGGMANPRHELITLAWLFGLALVFGLAAVGVFRSRDPAK